MFHWKKADKRPEDSVSGSPGRQEINIHTDMVQAEKELERLRTENNKLVRDADKYRVAFENEQRKRLAVEKASVLLSETQEELVEAQKKLFEYEVQLSDFDAQFWFFWSELPEYASDTWLERWQKLSPPPLAERLKDSDEASEKSEK